MNDWPPRAAGDPPRRTGEGAPATRVVHAGLPAAQQGTPFLPGPVLAAPYHLSGPSDASRYGYARYANPTWTAYEAALGELEDGEAVLFSSGMAAVAAVLVPALQPGDVVVVPGDGYPGVTTIATEQLAPRGIEVRVVASDEEAIRAALPGASLVWIETPSNPMLDVLDVEALAAAAHDAGALLAVDNTLATPLLQRPLELGADLSIASASKLLTGHSDLVLGYVASPDPARTERLRSWRGLTGAIAGPFETWLAHRSLATLDVRHARQCANALALAHALDARADVHDVRYPGLPGHRAHALATHRRRLAGLHPLQRGDRGRRRPRRRRRRGARRRAYWLTRSAIPKMRQAASAERLASLRDAPLMNTVRSRACRTSWNMLSAKLRIGTGWFRGAVKTTALRALSMSRPSSREMFTPPRSDAVNVMTVWVDSTPGSASWSRHCASRRPIFGMIASGTTGPGSSSMTRMYRVSDVEPPFMTPETKRSGMRPLPGPAVAVATRLPSARFRVLLAATALLPSTAPAFSA